MSFADLLAAGDVLVRETLGESVTYTPGVGSAVIVSGIFDAVYVKVEAGEAGIASQGPSVALTLTDLPSNPADDTGARLTIRGTQYLAYTVEPDGQGMVRLLLHEV